MDLRTTETEEDIEVNMSPMIDMVFLLLIFFIVASNIIDEKVKVDIPFADYAKVPEDVSGRFELTVKKDGGLYIQHKQVTLQEFKERLRPEVAANPKLRVLIRADGDVRYKVSEKLMEACGEVGAVDLIFSAYETI